MRASLVRNAQPGYVAAPACLLALTTPGRTATGHWPPSPSSGPPGTRSATTPPPTLSTPLPRPSRQQEMAVAVRSALPPTQGASLLWTGGVVTSLAAPARSLGQPLLQVLLAILTGQPVAHTDAPPPRSSLSPAGAAIEVNDMTLAPADAAELAEMLQFLSDWLARDRDHLEASPEGASSVTAPTAPASCTMTWLASSSC